MGPKRWILTLSIIALVIGLLVLLFLQTGADTRIVETLLPRVEERFHVKLKYDSIDVSLTSVSFQNLVVLPASGSKPLMRVGRLSIQLRVGPLLKGDLDVTGLRLDELQLTLGDASGGATAAEWSDFARTITASRSRESSLPGVSKTPEIHIVSGSASAILGNLSVVIDSFRGRSDDSNGLAITARGYRLKSGDTYLVRGAAAELQLHREKRTVSVQLAKPSFELPGRRTDLRALAADLSRALKSLDVHSDAPATPANTADSAGLDASVEISSGGLTVLFPESEARSFVIADLSGRLSRTGDGKIHFVGGGGLPETSSHWTVEGNLPGKGTARVVLDFPDVALRPFIAAFFDNPESVDVSKGVCDGRVAISVSPDRRIVTFEGQTAVAGIRIQHPSLSADPLENLNGNFDFKIGWHRDGDTFSIERLSISQGLARLGVLGTFQKEPLQFDLKISIPPTSCRQLLSAIPSALRDRIGDVRIDGQISTDLHLGINALDPDATILDGTLNNRCQIADFGSLPEPAEFHGTFAYMAYDKDGSLFKVVSGPGSGRWAPLTEISPYIVEAALTTEDGKFRSHNGMTLPEVRRAIAMNMKKSGALHGASTITMQLAKNLFLSRERTVARKLQELFFTWYLESLFSKEEILELYFNVIEFGPSIYGIVDASRHYFGREPSELSLSESVFLIKLLPSPVARHRAWENGSVSERQMNVLRQVMLTMLKRGRITRAEYDAGLLEEISFYREGDPTPEPRLPANRDGLRLMQDDNGDWVEDPALEGTEDGWGEN